MKTIGVIKLMTYKNKIRKSFSSWAVIRCRAERIIKICNQITESINKTQNDLFDKRDRESIPERIIRFFLALHITKNSLINDGLL